MTIHNEDGNTKQSTVYSWASASVTAAGTAAATNLVGVSGFTTLLTNFTDNGRRPRRIKVSAGAAAYLSINGGDTITLGATTPFEADDLVINSLGISTGGAGVTITVTLQ